MINRYALRLLDQQTVIPPGTVGAIEKFGDPVLVPGPEVDRVQDELRIHAPASVNWTVVKSNVPGFFRFNLINTAPEGTSK